MSRRAVAAMLVAAGLVACHGRAGDSEPSALDVAPVPAAGPSASAATPRDDRSIYALSMTLTDQDGAKVGLDVFRGRPVFVGMFYGRCPSACPVLVSTIKRTLSELDPATAAEVRVLLVSFDPEHDDPGALRALFAERGLDARWKLASAPEDQVRDLAAVLGIQYRRLPDGNFSHSSSVILLDRAGAIDARLDDTSQSAETLVARARGMVGHER
jgi:protein SCO1/2